MCQVGHSLGVGAMTLRLEPLPELPGDGDNDTEMEPLPELPAYGGDGHDMEPLPELHAYGGNDHGVDPLPELPADGGNELKSLPELVTEVDDLPELNAEDDAHVVRLPGRWRQHHSPRKKKASPTASCPP